MSKSSKLLQFANKVQETSLIKSIRNGLVNMIPVLIIGAFALILKTFPFSFYQNFINSFLNGFLLQLFDFVYCATFGVLSVYMTFSISRSYMKIKAGPDVVHAGAIFVSIICFFILSGALLPNFGLNNMGPKSMLLAIIAGLGASALYTKFYLFFERKRKYMLTRGADRELNKMLSTLFPTMLVTGIFALANIIIIRIFSAESFHDLYITLLNKLFSLGDVGFIKGFFFVFWSSLLWFFGVHGSDALEGVMQTYFVPNLVANQEAVEAGLKATNVLTKEFFDCFVLMGGCGAAICLLISILIFSKTRSRRSLGLTAAFPMIFNINELMVFGLPIIFNPLMLIPFLTVPLVCYTSAYIAISTGIVPMITSQVEWTTPVIMGGYYATGSVAGSLLQLFNIAIGIAIYFPFVKILDRQTARENKENYDKFVQYFMDNEQTIQNIKLIELNNLYGDFAKELCADLRHDLVKNMEIFYQPQYNYDGKCIGVEALLRWRHPEYSYLYPPIVVKLAYECDLLIDLEQEVVTKVLNQRDEILKKYGDDIKISINITGSNIVNPKFIEFLQDLNKEQSLKDKNVCLEVTEKEAFELNEDTFKSLQSLRDLGFMLAIDDFSMGQTSIHYLRYDLFDIIKIDGFLVKGLITSPNCREIISSISELSESLSMLVIAEYVETEEEKEALHEIGCNNYQGYLYSEAKPLEEKNE